MYYSKPGYVDVVFSGLTNKPDVDGKWHIVYAGGKVIVPETIEYRFVFSMFGIGDSEIDYCCRSAMKKLDTYIQGMDWYEKLGYEPLLKVTPDMRNFIQCVVHSGLFDLFRATHFSYAAIYDPRERYRFEGVITMDGHQHYLYTKK